MKRIAIYLLPALGLIGISFHLLSCRTLSTQAGLPSSGPVIGLLFYYLPIGKITIKGEAPIRTPRAARTRPKNENNSGNIEGPSQSEATANVAAQSPPPSSGSPAGGDDGGKSPDSSAISGGQVTITLTAEVEADDETGVYYVSPQPNYIYEDEARVTVNAKHLLSTGNVTSEDKTAEIVGAVASLAANAAKALAFAAPEKPQPFTFSFHPHNRVEVDCVQSKLRDRHIDLLVTANGEDVTAPRASVHAPSQNEMEELKKLAELTTERGSPGLLFRPAASYKISLTYKDRTSGLVSIKNTQQFILPDPTKLYVMKYNRMAFVKKVREVGFTDGMLTDFHQKVPSPILGFLGIPKAVLEAMVPIPGAAGPTGAASGSGTSAAKN